LVRDERDFDLRFDYIHWNPVKHGLVKCPHFWQASSFRYWVAKGVYDAQWECCCEGREFAQPDFTRIDKAVGE
jgi:putative transposase